MGEQIEAMKSHMMAKHPMEWSEWEAVGGPETCDIQYQDEHGNQIHLAEAAAGEGDAGPGPSRRPDEDTAVLLGPDGVHYLAEVAEQGDALEEGTTVVLQTSEQVVTTTTSPGVGIRRSDHAL